MRTIDFDIMIGHGRGFVAVFFVLVAAGCFFFLGGGIPVVSKVKDLRITISVTQLRAAPIFFGNDRNDCPFKWRVASERLRREKWRDAFMCARSCTACACVCVCAFVCVREVREGVRRGRSS